MYGATEVTTDESREAPEARPRRLKRAEYELLARAGVFDDEHVELLFGEIVFMSPQGPEHSFVTNLLRRWLDGALAGRALTITHSPVAVGPDSEPEPGLAVFPPEENRPDRHPERLHFVLEVSSTSHARDSGPKALIYGRAGVPVYWVIDLKRRAVWRHERPGPDGYESVERAPITKTLALHVSSLGLDVPVGALFDAAGLLS